MSPDQGDFASGLPSVDSHALSPSLPPPLPVTQIGWVRYVPAPVLPRVWPVFIAPAVMFGMQILIGAIIGAGIVVYQSAHGSRIGPDDATLAIEAALTKPAIALPMFLSISIMTGAIAVCAARLSPAGIRRRLLLRPSTANPFTVMLLCIGTVSVGGCAEALLMMLSKQLGLRPGGSMKAIEDLIHTAGQSSLILTAVVLAIGPGIGEELLFRGYIQSRLQQRWGIRWAIFIAALMFGAAHADPMQSTLTVPLGAYMGWAAYRTGSTRTSIVCHIFNNLAVVLMLSFPLPTIDEVSISTLWLIFAFYGAVGVVCTLIAHYMLPPAPPPESFMPPIEPIRPVYAPPRVYVGPTV